MIKKKKQARESTYKYRSNICLIQKPILGSTGLGSDYGKFKAQVCLTTNSWKKLNRLMVCSLFKLPPSHWLQPRNALHNLHGVRSREVWKTSFNKEATMIVPKCFPILCNPNILLEFTPSTFLRQDAATC